MQFDAELCLMRLEWVPASDGRQLRTSALHLLGLLEKLRVRSLLLDMNTVPNLLVADQLWLGDYWMPGLVALPLQHLVLVIDTSRVHNQLAIDALHDLVKPAIGFESHYFADSESALDWLTNGSPRLVTLRAEWATRHA